jgi:hypothetical protein
MPEPRAKLNFIHICDTAFPSMDGKLNIIGIFENILAVNFPAVHARLTIVFNVSASLNKHDFKLRLTDSNSRDIVPMIEGTFELNPGQRNFGFIGAVSNVRFEKEGQYSAIVEIDGKQVGITKFGVNKLGIS